MGRDFTLQSRSEHILASIIDGTEYNAAKEGQPLSRIELLLLELKGAISGNPNATFRGKDLTDTFTVEQMYEKIHNGTFDGLCIGDHFIVPLTTDLYTHFIGESFAAGVTYYEMGGTVTDRTWTETEDATPQSGKVYATKQVVTEDVDLMFAGFDYYYNMGDTPLTTHHAVLIPRCSGLTTTDKMNATNVTDGGYYESDMHNIVLPCYAKSFKEALGGHILAHRTYLSSAMNATAASRAGGGIKGSASASTWTTTELQLMSEQQVYGTEVLTTAPYDIGIDYKKLPVFDVINPVQYCNGDFWLRTIGSSRWFAACFATGFAGGKDAYGANYVRPMILFG